MNAIEALYYYANMIMVVTMFTLTLMILVLCYFITVKKVIAKKENIDTGEMTIEMMISLHSVFAQAESESIVNNVRLGKIFGYKLGHAPMQYGKILGYRKGPDGNPEIVPEEAEFLIIKH